LTWYCYDFVTLNRVMERMYLHYFDLDITISNNELGGDYHIKIVTPLNYPYCK